MGAHSFQVMSRVPDPTRAYEELVATALGEYGSDPYNGSISTTRGVSVISRTPILAPTADRIEQSRIGALSKWGSCEAIAVGVPAKTRSVTRSVDVHPFIGEAEFLEAAHIAAALGVEAELLASYRLLESRPKFRFTVSGQPAKQMVWSIDGRGEYSSRAEAVKAAKEAVLAETARMGERSYLPARPRVITQRIVTMDPVVVTPVRTAWRVRVQAEVSVGPVVFDHWRFYGWAAS
jgi:hypothetical protein